MPYSIGIIGRGRVGTSLALAWRRAGHGVRFVSPALPSRRMDALVLAVPDRAVREVAERIGHRAPPLAAHVSGSLDVSALEALAAPGVHLGSLHPLLAIARPGTPLEGGWAAVDGDAFARRRLGKLARDAGLRVLARVPGDRARYHLAAVLASNSLAPLLAQAKALMVQSGVGPVEAEAALITLMRSSVEALARSGLAEGLTGPIARGDAGTVARHLELLEEAKSPARDLYLAAGRAALELARERHPRPPHLGRMAALLRR